MKDYKGVTIEQAKSRIKEIKKWQDESGKIWEEGKAEPFELQHLQEHFNLTNSDVNKIVGMNWLGQERELGDWRKIEQLMAKENLAQEEAEKLSSKEIDKRLGIQDKPSEGLRFK